MLTPIPSVDVWQSKSAGGEILLFHKGALFAPHVRGVFYSGNVSVGKIEVYSREEFVKIGLSLIKKSLDGFPARKQTPQDPRSEIDSMSPKQKRLFFAQHRQVSIGPEDGMLRLDPVYHEKVGVMGGSREPIYVSFDSAPEEFMSALTKCFLAAD